MSKYFYLKNKKEKIRLSDKPFAGGGEGDLYRILSSGYRKYVAKLYHAPKRTAQREQKIKYLLENPPIGIEDNNVIVWITDILYDRNNRFVGFIMPFVKGEKLEVLCTGRLPRKLKGRWQRFGLATSKAIEYRLRVCFNLAAAIYQVHATDHYVLVDMKPDNIIIQPNGILAIVDMDSVEVVENGKAIFPAPVATPEYTPPEFYTPLYRSESTVGETWDRFGLAVIFYKLLFGLHPYATTAHPPYDNLVSLHDKIKEGLFAHHPNASSLLRVIPPPHQKFYELPLEIQELFVRCFIHGHDTPGLRPSANEWCAALLSAIGDEKLAAHFAHIMGLGGWRPSYDMPSSLLRKHRKALDLEYWVKEQLSGLVNVPPLSSDLRSKIYVGKQEVQLAVEPLDRIISGGVVAVFVLLMGVIKGGFWNWITIDFWLNSIFFINSVLFLLIMIVVFVLPYVVSWGRHQSSRQVALRQSWNRFVENYPALQQKAKAFYQQLQASIQPVQQKIKEQLEQQSNTTLKKLKNFLRTKDEDVQELITQQKETFAAIDEKYVAMANKNPTLRKLKGRSVFDLSNKLGVGLKMELRALSKMLTKRFKNQAAFQQIEKEYQEKKKALDTIKEAKMKEFASYRKSIYDIDTFVDTHAKSNSLLKRFFDKEISSNSFLGLEAVQLSYNKQSLFLKFDNSRFLEINKSIHNDLASLYKAFSKLLPVINYLEEKGFISLSYSGSNTDHPVHKEMQHKYDALKKKYDELANEKLEEKIAEESKAIKAKFAAAEKEVETLLTKEKAEKEKLLPQFEEAYAQQMQVVEERMKLAIDSLEAENKKIKIEVQEILQRPTIKNQKIEIDKAAADTKKAMQKLENFSVDFKNKR